MMLTLSAVVVIAQIRPTVESLPDGDYRYRDSFEIDRPFREIQFRKQDRYITGSAGRQTHRKKLLFSGNPPAQQHY